jgi:hypothetical protein
LGPVILTQFVKHPFTEEVSFDYAGLIAAVTIQVRFLDNVLDVTLWPLPQQHQESVNKRRVGVGFTGLGNTLAMLGLNYNSDMGRDEAAKIARVMRDAAYCASIDLAKERGKFPLFNADEYLKEGTFASRLPASIQAEIRKHGIRNSHLLSIAPVGTVSLAFADNASNGIEPPFSLVYTRKKRMGDGTTQEYTVVDHSLRVYLSTLTKPEYAAAILEALRQYRTTFSVNGDPDTLLVKEYLPLSLITALELSTNDHLEMLKAVQPFIDSSISKCVAKGTRIMTNQGLLKVEDLGQASLPDTFAPCREGLQVLCPDGQWRRVLQHYYGGTKLVVKVRLSNGQIIAGSEVHKLKTPGGWTQMSELNVGDWIQIRRNVQLNNPGGKEMIGAFFACNAKDYAVPTHMSPDLALLFGMICADGHLQEESGFIGLHKNHISTGEKFTELVKMFFGAKATHTVDPRTGVHCWSFNSRALCRWIKSIIGYRSYDKHAPESVMQGSKEEMKAFLTGITLDGFNITNSNREYTALYEGRSFVLAQNAFSMLVALGYQPRLTSKNVPGYGYKVWGIRATGIDFCLQEHKNSAPSEANEYVSIPPGLEKENFSSRSTQYYAIRSWNQNEGVVCKEQQLNRNFPDSSRNGDIIYCQITHKEFDFDEIYDIEVEESHDYLIDGVVSHNTVNVPADCPLVNFMDIYDKAWVYKLKGVSTYRPNSILGSVLSIGTEVKKEEEPVVVAAPDSDPLNLVIHDRPDDELDSVTKKVRYSSHSGDGSLYVSVSFATVEGSQGNQSVSTTRPIEVFITASPDGVPAEWVAVYARNLSLLARSGLTLLAKALQDGRNVKSDKGRVRYGWYIKADGSKVPRFHDSEVACIAYAVQEILVRKGLLNAFGNAVTLKKVLAQTPKAVETLVIEETIVLAIKSSTVGKKCSECGDHAVIKVDGCERCTACGTIGSCG